MRNIHALMMTEAGAVDDDQSAHCTGHELRNSRCKRNKLTSDLGKPVDSILEHDHAVPILRLLTAPCPSWMLCGIDMSLGMWHQPKDPSTGIANTSDVCVSAIRIMRKWQNVVLNTALHSFCSIESPVAPDRGVG